MSEHPASVRVLKFGGTSLESAERIENVVDIVLDDAGRSRQVVVVSAMGGVTSLLARAADAAARGDEEYRAMMDAVRAQHAEPVSRLVSETDRSAVSAKVEGWLGEVSELLRGVSLVRECSARTRDSILSFGELLSSTLVAAALRGAGSDAAPFDARRFLVTDGSFGEARLDGAASAEKILRDLPGDGPMPVVTGFIAATPQGDTTTLGRGGSDYTAAILGAVLDADRVEIWTDVDGVMSADPRLVPDAFPLEALSYDELVELSHFGAKVVYPAAVHPARERGIPLVIRNTLRPSFPGTRVGSERPALTHPVRGIASINDVALLRLQGDGMVGVPGIAERLFGALARSGISVILISQASSEHSICFAVDPNVADQVRACVDAEFLLERRAGWVDDLIVESDRSVVAAVGEAMRETPGIAGRLFSVLGRAGINVRAIAQGSSELNISLVVAREDERRALSALHRVFFTPTPVPVHVYLVGAGRVGAALLDQLASRGDWLRAERHLDVRVVGIATSRRSAYCPDGLPLPDWHGYAGSEPGVDPLLDLALEASEARRVFVDCTANADVAERYTRLLEAGVAVVAANKLAFTGPLDRFRALRAAGARSGLFFETTVGAGLPVLRTAQDLIETGDEVTSVDGVLSGTLGYLFDEVMKGRPFSEAVHEAWRLGYTEPDPREDLSGGDVGRKLLILGRACGMDLEPDDVVVEPMPGGTGREELPVEEFLDGLKDLDGRFSAWREKAHRAGRKLCYLASISPDGARVGVTEISAEHPCAGLEGTDNLVAFRTRRYPAPLVIRGAGAGPAVTAAGVFADVLRAVADVYERT